MDIKKTLIAVWITAGILGVIAYFVVFYSGGNYIVKESGNTGSSSFPAASSTALLPASSTTGIASGTPSSTAIDTPGGSSESFASTYSSPAASWKEGNETMSITGASLQGNQLTLDLEIDMGPSMECVPMNMRLLADEEGDLVAPATTQFSFPETGTCEGAPNATYGGENVVFTVDPGAFPAFVTTGGTSNIFLQISTTTNGGLTVQQPSQSG